MNKLSDIVSIAKTKGIRRLAVAAAEDRAVLEAIRDVIDEGYIAPILIGNKLKIREIAGAIGLDLTTIEIIDEQDISATATKAVSLVKQGKADTLMKGFISTGQLLKAVLDKESGLRKNKLLSHFSLFESPYYHKLLGITDVAMNIAPSFEEKLYILDNSLEIMHKLGFETPKVAVLAPVETVNEKIESTVHAALMSMMGKRKQISGCLIDGPLALDNAISAEAAKHKGIAGEVAGDADLLLVPDLNSGNLLYKSLMFMGNALSASVIAGATVPVVLTSRSDSAHTKAMSIALAAALS